MTVAEVIAGDTASWHRAHVAMSGVELHQFANELDAMIRHPANWHHLAWQALAGARLAAVQAEIGRRAHALLRSA